MPSRMAYVDEARETEVEIDKKKTELLGKYLVDHPDRVPGGDEAAAVEKFIQTRMMIADETKKILAPLDAAFRAQQEKQQAFVDRLRFLSPAIVYQQIGQVLTGNDRSRHERFLDIAESHHERLQAFFFPLFVRDGPDFSAYQEIPRFVFAYRSLHEEVPSILSALAGLLLPTLLLAIIGWRRMKVVDVRGE